jgi:ketosteroid isomerase-like protein
MIISKACVRACALTLFVTTFDTSFSSGFTSGIATGFARSQEALPQALSAMADTEREFAAAAKVKGIRDAFLEFFADDAIAFNPEPVPAKDRLLKQAARPFSVNELLWEPRTGDVAASGELGWLTGPSTFIDHAEAGAPPHYGNYLSVWRKQPDGRWRVFIDVGSSLRAEAAFAPGFTRMPVPARYAGREGKAAAGQSLLDADRRLNARIGADGAARGYAADLAPGTRLHRPGGPPAVGAAAASAWLEQYAGDLSGTSTAAESAASGDLGYSYGKYAVKTPRAESGAYVRIWTRDATGHWLVVADVTQPVAPRP